MSSLRSLAALTAGAFAIAALSSAAIAAGPRDGARVTTELSAENKPDDKKKKAPPKGTVQKPPPHVNHRQVGTPPGGQKKFEVKKKIEVQKNIGTQKNIKVQKFVGKPKVFTPHGTNSKIVVTTKIRSAPVNGAFHASIRGRNYSVWRSGYRARYHGGWRTFVALSALGVIAIGAAEYYPYAYIDAPADYCDGLTEDGCQLVYDDVETEEGDVIPQCVAYCPWQQ